MFEGKEMNGRKKGKNALKDSNKEDNSVNNKECNNVYNNVNNKECNNANNDVNNVIINNVSNNANIIYPQQYYDDDLIFDNNIPTSLYTPSHTIITPSDTSEPLRIVYTPPPQRKNNREYISSKLDPLDDDAPAGKKQEFIVLRRNRKKPNLSTVMKPFDVSKSKLRNCIISDTPHVANMVISAEYLFNHLFKQCIEQQYDLFGYDDSTYQMMLTQWLDSKRLQRKYQKPRKLPNPHIYTNNYVIFVDTVLRMCVLFDRFILEMKRTRCSFDKIVLINDISSESIPRPKQQFVSDMRCKCTRERIASTTLKELKYLLQIHYNDECDEYDSYVIWFMKTYPEWCGWYDFYNVKRKNRFIVRESKEEFRRRWIYWIGLLQMQLSMKETWLSWQMVFDILSRRKDIDAYTFIEKWGKNNMPKLIVGKESGVVNEFVKGKFVGERGNEEGKVNNAYVMNELANWLKYSNIEYYGDEKIKEWTDMLEKRRKETNDELVKMRVSKKMGEVYVPKWKRCVDDGWVKKVRKGKGMKGVMKGVMKGRSKSVNDVVRMKEEKEGRDSIDMKRKQRCEQRMKEQKKEQSKQQSKQQSKYQRNQQMKEQIKQYIVDDNEQNKRQKYKPTNKIFDFNIIHLFNSNKCLFITRQCVPYDNIFYYDFENVYYPISSPCSINCDLDENVSLTKYKQHKRTIISCFDDINRECGEHILDLNEGLYLMMYQNLHNMFVLNKVSNDVPRPDIFHENEHQWILKPMMDGFISDLVRKFNQKFKTKVL